MVSYTISFKKAKNCLDKSCRNELVVMKYYSLNSISKLLTNLISCILFEDIIANQVNLRLRNWQHFVFVWSEF